MIYKPEICYSIAAPKINSNSGENMKGSVVFFGLVLATILVLEVRQCHARDLTIAAFNVQIFGQKKANDAFVMETLVKIIQRYDIILIQEIRDSKETAIFKLQNKVNEASPTNPFDMKVSPRMGRSSSKEQYAFLYRRGSGLRVENIYVYDDGDEGLNNKSQNIIVDTFEREPYIIHFSSSNTDLKEFALCGIHVAPEEAVHEIQALKEVFVDIQQRFRISDIMVMGDLNADCSYVPKKSWAEISLKSDPSYHWLLGDEEDTTVSKTNCAYDRFIGKGGRFSTAESGDVVAGSPRVFNYMQEYGLTLEKALDISDHYPIEFKLKGRGGKTSRYNPHSTTPISFVTNGHTLDMLDGHNGVTGHRKNKALTYLICLCFISYMQRPGNT